MASRPARDDCDAYTAAAPAVGVRTHVSVEGISVPMGTVRADRDGKKDTASSASARAQARTATRPPSAHELDGNGRDGTTSSASARALARAAPHPLSAYELNKDDSEDAMSSTSTQASENHENSVASSVSARADEDLGKLCVEPAVATAHGPVTLTSVATPSSGRCCMDAVLCSIHGGWEVPFEPIPQ